ncbi:MAG: petC [Burkholderiaceae bacterium]|nr:petC [Burkholderiaceae bacterium]
MRANIVKLVYLVTACMVAGVLYLMSFGAAHSTTPPLKSAKVNLSDKASLQRGAAAFRDYCFNCHGLSAVRYNQLTKIGLSEDNIKQYMLTTTTKPGDMMTVGMNAADAKKWFGVAPPDLSLMASAKGTDYIFSYLNDFYRDETRPTGWNNRYWPNAAMPHVLWEEQGTMVPIMEDKPDPADHTKMVPTIVGFNKATAGKRDEAGYEQLTNDITNFLFWASEPDRQSRHFLGYIVLAFLLLLAFLASKLSKNYWKDIH